MENLFFSIGDKAQPCLFVEDVCSGLGYFKIFAESFRTRYELIRGKLSSLAEAVARPPLLHEYHLTPFSLGAAVSNGISEKEAILFFLDNCYGLQNSRGEDTALFGALKNFLHHCISRYNLARVMIDGENTIVLCKNEHVAQEFLKDAIIQSLLKSTEVKSKICLWDGEERQYSFLLAKSRAVSKLLCERCAVLGYPLWQQYDYESDSVLRTTSISLSSHTRPRPYQIESVEAATKENVLNSGCLLLPCGAGKTLVGIMVICKVKKPTLIVCAGSVSVDQWKNQLLEYASLDLPANEFVSSPKKVSIRGADRIACITGKQKDEITEETDIVLTTYSMLVSAFKAESRKLSMAHKLNGSSESSASRKRRANPKEKLFASYGLLILDEVHVIPADAFRESLSFIDAKATIGLTATYVREDRKILDLFHLVGPKLFDISMESLVNKGYLAKVQCIEVHTPMTKEFGLEYMDQSIRSGINAGRVSIQVMLAASNPNKMYCVRDLVSRHLDSGAKILVFCDHILLLEEYGKMLCAPVVCGSTQIKDRLMIFSDFQTTNKLNVICISRVGDVSVNLPSANVVIQVSSHGGSRRQEAQRLGRILRPKEKSASTSSSVVQAWFYSIVSTDTLEMAYAAHRTAFLVDLGYATRIIEYTRSKVNSNQPARGVKKNIVGDIHSVKHEELSHALSNSRYLMSDGIAEGNDSLLTLEYQIQLLAKVVSRWEIEYQENQRMEERGGSPTLKAQGDEDVEVIERSSRHRSYQWIKKDFTDTAEDIPLAGGVTDLRNAVGVDDFIYHEF